LGPSWPRSTARRRTRSIPAGATRWRPGPSALTLDGVCFCHGSPRSEDELLTVATPDDVLADACAGVAEPLVVGGHTHRQFVRRLRRGLTFANAGSVGLPYEGRPAAFWMVVHDGEPQPREMRYDLDSAIAELRAAGFAAFDAQLERALLQPADPDAITAFLERAAGR
jgi:hypothetical protein